MKQTRLFSQDDPDLKRAPQHKHPIIVRMNAYGLSVKCVDCGQILRADKAYMTQLAADWKEHIHKAHKRHISDQENKAMTRCPAWMAESL